MNKLKAQSSIILFAPLFLFFIVACKLVKSTNNLKNVPEDSELSDNQEIAGEELAENLKAPASQLPDGLKLIFERCIKEDDLRIEQYQISTLVDCKTTLEKGKKYCDEAKDSKKKSTGVCNSKSGGSLNCVFEDKGCSDSSEDT